MESGEEISKTEDLAPTPRLTIVRDPGDPSTLFRLLVVLFCLNLVYTFNELKSYYLA